MNAPLRRLGSTDIFVSPVAFGGWPIAGMTSPDANETDSLATIAAAHEAGINFFDTAYGYGTEGESERMLAQALGHVRDEVILASKGGIHWDADRNMVNDARPATLRRECEESLQRLNTDYIDLFYLHSPDADTPVADSAGVLLELMQEGKCRAVGASNCTLEQYQEFAAVCPLSAIQPPYNMLQRQVEQEMAPWCLGNEISICVYWPLMKGLLAGKLARDHQFAPTDSRLKYPMYRGEEWEKNQDFVDVLRRLAAEADCSLAEIVTRWTISQPGITAALCGAKRPWQIQQSAAAMQGALTPEQTAAIHAALEVRGTPEVRRAV